MVVESNRWMIRDVITAIILSVLLILVQVILNLAFMLNNFVSMVLSTPLIVLILGPIYTLLVARVAKHGASLLYFALLGLAYLASGNWYLLPWYLLVGLLCEVILWRQNRAKIIAACTVNGFLHQGANMLPVVFFWDTYYDFAVASGQDPSYIGDYLHYYTHPGWLIFVLLLTLLCAFGGGLIGSKLVGKHFQKAGLI